MNQETAPIVIKPKFRGNIWLWSAVGATTTLLIVAVVLLVSMSAKHPAASPSPTPATSASPSPSTSSTPAVSPSPSATPAPTPTPTPTATLWPMSDYSKSYSGPSATTATLVAIRTGAHPEGNYDRIALDFTGADPGYTVKYVNNVTRDGSGAAVSMTGNYYLQLVFNPAAAHDNSGNGTLSPSAVNLVNVGFPELQSYVLNGDFEGYASVALGLSAKTGFKVGELKNGSTWTVYIDVLRP